MFKKQEGKCFVGFYPENKRAIPAASKTLACNLKNATNIHKLQSKLSQFPDKILESTNEYRHNVNMATEDYVTAIADI